MKHDQIEAHNPIAGSRPWETIEGLSEQVYELSRMVQEVAYQLAISNELRLYSNARLWHLWLAPEFMRKSRRNDC